MQQQRNGISFRLLLGWLEATVGVDPYYLTHRAIEAGYIPEIILAGRRLNDEMSQHAANKLYKAMASRNVNPFGSKVLVIGVTFKENCADIRNTKIADFVGKLTDFGINVDVFDPIADQKAVLEELGLNLLCQKPSTGEYDAIVVAVGHTSMQEMGVEK